MKRLGAFYREKVLGRDDLVEKEIPACFDGEAVVEHHLFGWRLRSGRDMVDFESEEEARFCKIFLEAGLPSVLVPKDLKYLRSILPELEELKAKHDRVINDYLEGLFGRQLREKFLSHVWHRIMNEESG